MKNFKTIFTLITYNVFFNTVFLIINFISFEYAQIGFIYIYIILVFQLLALPIYFYFIGKSFEYLQPKQLIYFTIVSSICGIAIILFSFIYYASSSMIDLYLQGLVCSLFPVGILIDQFFYFESNTLYICVTIILFIIETICKVIFIKIGNKKGNQGTVL